VEAPRERTALVPVATASPSPSNDVPPDPDRPAKPAGDRPKLTRIK
jgi:hypothetical protein